jgi:hypothetical protein
MIRITHCKECNLPVHKERRCEEHWKLYRKQINAMRKDRARSIISDLKEWYEPNVFTTPQDFIFP